VILSALQPETVAGRAGKIETMTGAEEDDV